MMAAAAAATLAALAVLALLVYRRDLSRRLEHAQSRLAAQAALRASDQRFRDLAESIPHLVWTCRADGACDYLSPQWVRYTGVPESEQLGYRWLARLHPDDAEGVRAAWAEAAERGTAFDVQFRIRRHDGVYRWFQTRAVATRDESGHITRWYGSNTDIQDLREMTELARARSQVATLSERLQLATSAARIGVWDWDVAENALVWDETMHRLYETDPGAFGGAYDAWKSRAHPEDLAAAEAELESALTGARPFDTVFRIVCPDGRVKHLRASAELQRDASGRAHRLVGVNWDVTDQRVAELALRNSEALQRGILAHAGPGLIATDLSGTITLFNRAAEEMLGYAASEVIHRATPVLIHVPEEIEARRVALERELGARIDSPFDVFVIKSRGGKPDANEWTYVRKDGSRLPVLLTVSSLLDDDDALIGYLGVAVDLTERKRQERELVELNRLLAERSAQAESASQAKTMFLASMSHEIRTPMNAITGAAYLLGRSELSVDQRELLGTVETATHSLLAMVNDILDLSKIEAGQLALESAPFDLDATMQSLRSLVSGLAAQKQLSLVIELDGSAPRRVAGDGGRLAQVLTNLLSNAIKFADGGVVRLCTKALPASEDGRTWLLFEVTDEGPGIAPDVVPRLFSAFTQGPGARRVGGTGLGLAIVKELVTLMGGEVGVDTVPGTGSRFWCRIPFASANDVGRSTPTPPPDGAPRLPGTRILVVDDSRINQRIARRILELEGASVELLDDGLSAIERVVSGAPLDLVLMDVQMPEVDGLEATRRIRASGSTIPVVALTAGALASERAAALDAGMSDFVTKPFQPDALIGVVRRHLAQRARESGAALRSYATSPRSAE